MTMTNHKINGTNLKPSVIGGSKKSTSSALKLSAISLAMILAGCSTHIDKLPDSPQVELPTTYEPAPTIDKAANTADDSKNKAISQEPVKNGWVEAFGDPDLTAHVQKALQNNPDLWNSASQLRNAIEQVTITGASLWPSLQLVGTGSNSESSAAAASGGAVQGEGGNNTTEIRSIGGTLNVSWELDVWRKLSQRKKAAALGAKAQTELYKAAELSLVANVSRAWFNVITNKLQLDLAQRRLDSFERTANLIEENYERGLRSALDVYLSRTDVQVQRASLADSKFSYLSSLRAFKTLLGEYPDTSLAFNAKLPEITDNVTAGLPANLLTRRPDVKASQLRYQASIANAKAARRDRFPSLNFTGTIGESRDTFNSVFDSDNMIERFLLNLTTPVFAAGSLKSREDQAYNDAEAAYAGLVRTSLTAFEEVENTLSREALLKQQYEATKEAVKLAEGGLNLALDRYQSGIENYNTVLQSQRSLFNSMSNEINIRNALLQNRIGIHLALGGSFTNAERNLKEALPSPMKAKSQSETSADDSASNRNQDVSDPNSQSAVSESVAAAPDN